MRLTIIDNKLFLDDKHIGILEQFGIGKCDNAARIKQDLIGMFTALFPNEIIENLEITFNINKNYYYIWKQDNKTYLTVDNEIDVLEWSYNLSIRKFYHLFSKSIGNFTELDYEIEFHEEERFVNIYMTLELDINDNIKNSIEYVQNIYKKRENDIINLHSINKSIEFSPEHLSAGTSILQYFGKLLQEKYPNENVSVSIKQEGLKVSMSIETPDGKKEEIEEYLNKFGMVVINQITPEEFTSNPMQLLELETKLGQAEQEIRFQKKLLALQDKTYDENLVSLKDEVIYLREELSALRVSNNENIQLLLSSLQLKDKTIKKLTKAIENKDDNETKSLLLELKQKDSQGYISLKQHIDNVIIGGVVNAPSWVQFIITHFPK